MKYLVALLLGLPVMLNAQAPDRYLFAGVNANTYKGDMGDFNQWNAGFHAGIQFNKKKKLNGAIQLTFGSVSDQQNVEENTQISQPAGPNNYFKSTFFAINYEVHYNIIKTSKWLLYISQGAGFIRYTPKDESGKKLEDQPGTRAEQESYRSSSLMLPSSIGGAYFLKNEVGIGIQTTFYNPLTDYLDNISELGDSGNDNILNLKFSIYLPLALANEN
ncbi:hypothetical protein [Fulvivirga sp.]|uniref:hypothetical protein n=1 Tax=Fulvivirga sp. TaxID=1931237 RepID=UPI0032F04610